MQHLPTTSPAPPVCRDEVNLFNPNGSLVATAKWSDATMGSALHVTADGSYVSLSEMDDVITVLRDTGRHKIFLDALATTGMDKLLTAASAPDYQLPQPPKPKEQTELAPQFPWWFGFGVVSSRRAGLMAIYPKSRWQDGGALRGRRGAQH